jgi:hypothetical protein
LQLELTQPLADTLVQVDDKYIKRRWQACNVVA